MKTLVAGPWTGEFGWELMKWQAHIRYLASNEAYKNVVIYSRSGHELLYEDFATDFIPHNIDGEKNGYKVNEILHKLPADCRKKMEDAYGDLEIVEPGVSFEHRNQKFVSFSTHSEKTKYDLIFNARSTDKLNTSYRNWHVDNWNCLRSHFDDLRIASVGVTKESEYIEGTDNLMDISLVELADLLSESKMIIGPSSGVMHFASLCECTHMVFTDKSLIFEGCQTNRYRYEEGWNPLNTKSIVIDEEGWRPELDTVISVVEGELS